MFWVASSAIFAPWWLLGLLLTASTDDPACAPVLERVVDAEAVHPIEGS
jgi:hypothetical protein